MDLDGQWTQAGLLNQARSGHNVIFDGEFVMVIGGGYSCETQKCLIKSENVTCTAQNPELNKYVNYPELFLVSDDYCKN